MARYLCFTLILALFSIGCTDQQNKTSKEFFAHNNGRDTISVTLLVSEKTFHGFYEENGPGGFLVKGDISGDVKGDTLLGSLYYTPYKARNKKRKAFALLKQEKGYTIGKGTSYQYMGVPYFNEETLTFNGDILMSTNRDL